MAKAVSTGQIIAQQAAEQRAERQSQLAAPTERQRTGASTALGLLSQGLGNATDALTAGARRETAQANLDRANAIRLEAQDYTRGKQQEAFDYRQSQDALTNQRADASLQLRRQQAAQSAANAAARLSMQQRQFDRQEARLDRQEARADRLSDAQIAALDAGVQSDAQLEQDLANAGLTNFENTDLYKEVDTFNKRKAEQGDSFNPKLDYFESLPKELQTADTYDNLEKSVNANVERAKKNVAKVGGAWDDQYQDLATQKALQRVGVDSSGILGTGEGIIKDSKAFQDILLQEMSKLGNFKAQQAAYTPIIDRYNKRNKAAQLQLKRAQLQR